MQPGLATRTTALGVAALMIASALGYWGISAYRKGQLQKTVTALVKDSSERLQAALAVETEAVHEDAARMVGKLDDQAQEVDKHVIELRGMSASPNRALVDDAEEYLLTVRQILRNQAASHRYRIQVLSSERALRDHMRTANRRSGTWIQEALRAKDRMEKEYFDYRLSVDTFGRLLESYPATRSKLAMQVGSGLLVDEAVAANARKRALATSRRVADDEETAKLSGSGERALVAPTDVTDQKAVRALFAAAKEKFGRLDVLFNNAGIGTPGKIMLEDLTLEQWLAVVNTNLTGMFLCTQEAFKIMKSQSPRGGRIINNGSISAHAPRPNSAPYTSTKHAVTGLTKSSALDGRKYDIACGQIDIGNARTPLAARMADGVPQANGEIKPEPLMDVDHVGAAVLHMANLPLDTNVQFMTIMATKMPFIGRG